MADVTARRDKSKTSVADYHELEKSIELNLPVSIVYDQWTQFEDFPKFMEGVKEVRQLDDKRLYWRANIGGKEKEWTAEITEQEPDTKIRWKSTSGARNDGLVTFDKLTDNQTKVSLSIAYDPEGPVENAGDAMGILSRRIEGDLKRFKEFIESRGSETGAWRGEIHGNKVERNDQ
jgi:uncharacterized membrane protein